MGTVRFQRGWHIESATAGDATGQHSSSMRPRVWSWSSCFLLTSLWVVRIACNIIQGRQPANAGDNQTYLGYIYMILFPNSASRNALFAKSEVRTGGACHERKRTPATCNEVVKCHRHQLSPRTLASLLVNCCCNCTYHCPWVWLCKFCQKLSIVGAR